MAHHYFASNGLGWATAPTKEEAIEKLWHARHTDVRKWLNNCHKEGSFGVAFWVCRVPLAEDSSYRIELYAPKVPGCTEQANMFLTYYSQKKIAYAKNPDDEIRRLKYEVTQETKA
jgi:hypothetical protein